MGDLADLRRLTQWSKDLGAHMVLINPLLAASPRVAAGSESLLSIEPTLLESPVPPD